MTDAQASRILNAARELSESAMELTQYATRYAAGIHRDCRDYLQYTKALRVDLDELVSALNVETVK